MSDLRWWERILIPHDNRWEKDEYRVLERILFLLHDWQREKCDCKKIEKDLQQIAADVKNIRDILSRTAESATLTFRSESMDATIQVGKTANAVFAEFDGPNGTGNQVPPTGAVSFASDNPSVATVDPTTGLCTGLAAGTANISGTDAGNGLQASAVLTVTAAGGGTAQSATLTLTPNP